MDTLRANLGEMGVEVGMSENYFNLTQRHEWVIHVEQKSGLSYLSWAWAWGELKKLHPDAFYTIYENQNGWFYHTDGRTCWVKNRSYGLRCGTH